jgi:hypothetical protein
VAFHSREDISDEKKERGENDEGECDGEIHKE